MSNDISLYNSSTYCSDVAKACNSIDLSYLKGKSILITGATGLIGSAIVDVLLEADKNKNAGITVLAAARNEEKLKKRFSGNSPWLMPVVYDSEKSLDFDFHADYIIHAASMASPNLYVSSPVNVIVSNFRGIYELLEYALAAGTQRVLYISSSEIYGEQHTALPIPEEALSRLNPISVRSSYGVSKLASETMCVSYSSQFGIETVIARPGHIYGPTARENDRRVSSLFPRKAAAGENIVMKSNGSQIRSYCYCFDCATALLTLLNKGKSSEAYNISNPSSILTIAEMAGIVAKCAGVELIFKLPDNSELAQANPMSNSSLASVKLESLGWNGLFTAEEGLTHTVAVLRETFETGDRIKEIGK